MLLVVRAATGRSRRRHRGTGEVLEGLAGQQMASIGLVRGFDAFPGNQGLFFLERHALVRITLVGTAVRVRRTRRKPDRMHGRHERRGLAVDFA